MATYGVGSNGNAAKGYKVGDYVVTGGGTYQIVAPNTAGANYNSANDYWSKLVDSGLTTYNWDGSEYGSSKSPSGTKSTTTNISSAQQYAQDNTIGSTTQKASQSKTGSYISAGSGQVSNPGEGTMAYDPASGMVSRTMPNGNTYYVNPGEEKYNDLYAEYVARYGSPANYATDIANIQIPEYQAPDTSAYEAQLQTYLDALSQPYTPVDASAYIDNTMGYDEAMSLATELLAPQYAAAKQQALNNASQNLDRAGLYNSVYGQGLEMAAENQISAEQQQAINNLAVSLVGQDRDWAMQQLNAAINENQFGASYNQSGLSTAASASLSMINNLVNQAAAQNDYALQATQLRIQQQAQALEAQYQQGLINQAELENRLLELEIEATENKNKSANSTYTVGSSNVVSQPDNVVPQPEKVTDPLDIKIGNGMTRDFADWYPYEKDYYTGRYENDTTYYVAGYGRVTASELANLIENDQVVYNEGADGNLIFRKANMGYSNAPQMLSNIR